MFLLWRVVVVVAVVCGAMAFSDRMHAELVGNTSRAHVHLIIPPPTCSRTRGCRSFAFLIWYMMMQTARTYLLSYIPYTQHVLM